MGIFNSGSKDVNVSGQALGNPEAAGERAEDRLSARLRQAAEARAQAGQANEGVIVTGAGSVTVTDTTLADGTRIGRRHYPGRPR